MGFRSLYRGVAWGLFRMEDDSLRDRGRSSPRVILYHPSKAGEREREGGREFAGEREGGREFAGEREKRDRERVGDQWRDLGFRNLSFTLLFIGSSISEGEREGEIGLCYGKPAAPQSQSSPPSTSAPTEVREEEEETAVPPATVEEKNSKPWMSPFFPFYSPNPAHSQFSKKSPAAAPASGGGLATAIPEEEGEAGHAMAGLDKSFGFEKGFTSKYEIGEEIERRHFGYACYTRSKKGELKGQQVAVKVIP